MKVVWTKQAKRDIKAIFDYIACGIGFYKVMRTSRFPNFYFGAALVATLLAGQAEGALHPTLLLAKREETLRPVVKVLGTDPVVVVDGKEVRIRSRNIFFAQRAPRYAEPTVELKGVSLSGIALKAVVNEGDNPEYSGGLIGGTSFFEARLFSRTELRGSFIALLVFDRAFLDGGTDQPATEIVVHDLRPIRAGIETKVKFTAALFSNSGSTKAFFPLLFAEGGAEIRTGFSMLAARYFSRIERVRLGRAIGEYRVKFANQNHEAVPFVRVSPMLPSDMVAPSHNITATLMLGDNGWVTGVRLVPNDSSELNRVLGSALSGWLFLPKLEGGEPVACQVVLPLKF